MSRGRDDSRHEVDARTGRDAERSVDGRPMVRVARTWPEATLDLPRETERRLVRGRDRAYLLDDRETRALATVGAFRVVSRDDLDADDRLRCATTERLEDLGLLRHETLADEHGTTRVVTLTGAGKALLDDHRDPSPDGRAQAYYAGIAKPRELRHDAQLYRLFQAEAARIERDGGRVVRVVLDYELKRDYQRYLHRPDRSTDATLEDDRRAFAETHDLPVVRGHLELPDLRIDYETPDGRLEHRDVELVTEHYSRGQLGGKAQAGFVMYRSGGGGTGRGGTPVDPRHLERL